MSIRTRPAALLLFGSGFCALIYQTAWLREFRLIFGASTAASAAVLGVFMAGLGFGGIILGRRVETATRPLGFYGHLEMLIASSAALSPALIFIARHVYVSLGGTAALGMTVGTIVRLLLSAVILGLPTFLMGGTLPAVARAVIRQEDVSRRALGTLYGVNTLGAVTGALAGTFYLFENFGNHLALWWATGLNFVIALLALRWSNIPAATATTSIERATEGAVVPAQRTVFLFIAAGAVGFAFLLMEMVWYRMLAPLFGGSTFAFGLILAIALLGIGLGGVLYAVTGVKRSVSVNLFALSCAAEALFIAIPYALGDRIAVAAMLLRPLGTLGFYGHVLAWAALSCLIILPAAFVSGFQFPLLISLLGSGRTRIGSQTGAAYAWNTIGALLGSLAGGFGFMPMFSAPGVWRLVVLLLGAVAAAAAVQAMRESRRLVRGMWPVSIAAFAAALLLTTGPTAFWRHSQIGIGGLRQYHASENEMRELINRTRRHILWEVDGLESSVALADSDSLAFIVNGKSDGNAKVDAGTQVMSGLIGAALHPHPESALVVGLGTGSTAGWLAAVPTMQRVDALELERSIVRVAEACAPVNHQALSNPKLHVTIGDGREILLTSKQKYDLIVSEPSNPYRAGVAGLFTREYYQSVEQRLNAGGMFLQWMQTYDIDDRTIEIFYQTLGSVFPNIESWQTEEGDLLLVATREPISYDGRLLGEKLRTEPFKTALRGAWHADGLDEFLGHYVGNNALSKHMRGLQPWPLNTDDRTVIEFAFARCVSATNVFNLPNLRAAAYAAGFDRPRIQEDAVNWDRVREAQISSFVRFNSSDSVQSLLTQDARNRAMAFVQYVNGDLASALTFWRAQPAPPRTLTQLSLVAECLAATADLTAERYVDELAKFLPLDAEAIRAELLLEQGKPDEAAPAMEHFLSGAHNNPWPDQQLIRRSLGRAENIATRSKAAAETFYDVLRTPFAVRNCDADRMIHLITFGLQLDSGVGGQHTAAALNAFEPSVVWQREFLDLRNKCYENVRDPRTQQAGRDLEDFISRQAFTADPGALARAFKSPLNEPTGYGN